MSLRQSAQMRIDSFLAKRIECISAQVMRNLKGSPAHEDEVESKIEKKLGCELGHRDRVDVLHQRRNDGQPVVRRHPCRLPWSSSRRRASAMARALGWRLSGKETVVRRAAHRLQGKSNWKPQR
eukprot:GHVT01073816.1.p1 GENE.GHVT01073816.1~~GHVT01073816.1.p1  ORF type:complete len:124 (+),score=13.20 GHVT01073816.1:856-1227(+)